MTMIERVARAMCEADGRDPDARQWNNENLTMAATYERRARAAIAAMRKPTAMMLARALEPDEFGTPSHEAFWQAMIDEALK